MNEQPTEPRKSAAPVSFERPCDTGHGSFDTYRRHIPLIEVMEGGSRSS